ncbi:hypothetical protein DL768_011497 [Monosporascus sp. mg162]|nr:hypothetical protein DL768_011497 [Monosporascus sp. mg162]
MVDRRRNGLDHLWDLLLIIGTCGATYYLARNLLATLQGTLADPDKEKHEQARIKARANLQRLQKSRDYGEGDQGDSGGRARRGPRIEDLVLNEYENLVALEVVPPEDIPVGFNDIGGLDDIIEEHPYYLPRLGYYSMDPQAVLQPAIIFIDEIDAVLGTRRSGEHEASGMVKAEFMTLWDGLTSANTQGLPARIVVLGATNRIHDIDEAILRRMPKKFPVGLPDKNQRLRILQLILKDTKIDHEYFNIDYIARVTAGMSGSDIKEACRDAAMAPIREFIREHRANGRLMSNIDPSMVRGIRTEDFFGRKGGGQILQQNHQKAKSSSDEYEDVEDDSNSGPRIVEE